MAIRLSGLQSNMDTEALVSALVSSYSLTKDNLVKAQTRLAWKQDKWKTMNSSIYGFYSGKLSSARYSKTYNLKIATISNSSYAKVTASSSAVNGTQTLEILETAATGYLTGGVISGKAADGSAAKVTGDSKLSDITGVSSGSMSVKVDGKTTTIDVTADMTVDQFTAKLKDAGVEASFDETNQRFFINAKTSGVDHDFSLTANNVDGLTTLQNLGLFTNDKATNDEYKKWAQYANIDTSTEEGRKLAAEFQKLKDDAYKAQEISYKDAADEYLLYYNSAKSNLNSLNEMYGSLSDVSQKADDAYKELNDSTGKYYKYRKEEVGTDGEVTVTFDTEAMEADGVLEDYNKLNTELSEYQSAITSYASNNNAIDESKDYVIIDGDGKAASAMTDETSAAYANLKTRVDSSNALIRSNSDKALDDKAAYSDSIYGSLSSMGDSSGAVKIPGADSKIVLNGATFTNNTNDFSINGLTIQATTKTGTEKITITTNTDTDGIYNTIKDFIKEYNTLIKSMDEAYNAASSKGYEPLTSEEKEAMTDDEVEKWETKIKDALLRKDSTLGNASTAMKNNMQKVYTINGKNYSLSSFGIGTLGYFTSGENEKGVLHIDGDATDASTAGEDDKLRKMIASDPETIVAFFSQMATDVYDDLGKRMASSSVSSIYTIYNDKEMATEYSEYKTKISDQEDKISRWEDFYYKKFTAMETALAKLNSQSSSLSSLFG